MPVSSVTVVVCERNDTWEYAVDLEEVIGTPKKEDFVSHMPICPYVYVDVYVGVYVYALLMSNEQVTCVVELGFEWWVIVTSSESRMVS
jgi:hypothetical protein